MGNIVDRGRTFDQVANPGGYPPFSKIIDEKSFNSACKSKPDWIFANMDHAAYHDEQYLKTRNQI